MRAARTPSQWARVDGRPHRGTPGWRLWLRRGAGGASLALVAYLVASAGPGSAGSATAAPATSATTAPATAGSPSAVAAAGRPVTSDLPLDRGWADPPVESRVRSYWWWLNGNVTKAAITRDLEEMRAKGFGGAILSDAGGAEQDGNDKVPHGPDFFSPAWRELYKHALREGDRLGLTMSLNIQSGWNLGGPPVKVEDAAKKLVWTTTPVAKAGKLPVPLAKPDGRDGFYRDLFVLAYPLRQPKGPGGPNGPAGAGNLVAGLRAESDQAGHTVEAIADGKADTFWASSNREPGKGPSKDQPAWLRFDFREPVAVDRVRLLPREGYGPKAGEVQASDDGTTFRTVKAFAGLPEKGETVVALDAPVTARAVRVLFTDAFDPRSPGRPRNVQVAEAAVGVVDEKAGGDAAGGKGVHWLGGPPIRRPIENLDFKAVRRSLSFSAPETSLLLRDVPPTPGEADFDAADVVDLTGKLLADGTLDWDAPAGGWEVLQVGYTVGDHSTVSTASEGWNGYALDVLDEGAFRRYWDAVVEPLIADAGPIAGRSFKYLFTDSWEVEAINWTPAMRAEFKARRGYDLAAYLPVLAGRIVGDRDVSNRFLHDFRKTIGDLAVDKHYKPFAEWAHQHCLGIHPESGGPHASPIDAQRCLGMDDAPMSEFWAESWRHRIGDANRFFVKQPASAAHTYGRPLVLAEGFTTIGPHWQETVWDNLKPSFDKAACEGLNLLVWHAFVCSPAEMGLPGQQYFAGTHLNPNVTWWPKSAAFLAYLNRCQWVLQQGHFVADACYYYGDHVPNFAQLRSSDPAKVGPGRDYDVITEEAILTRLSVRDGRLVLPDGVSYAAIVLPDQPAISLPVLRKVRELVEAGATVVGPRPRSASGLADHERADAEVRAIAEVLWGPAQAEAAKATTAPSTAPIERPARLVGNGFVVPKLTAGAWFDATAFPPDFEYAGDRTPVDGKPVTSVSYIHREVNGADVYFVASRGKQDESLLCTFRVGGKAPELWDPVTGTRRFATNYTAHGKFRTIVPIEFPPCGSAFVVFREPAADHPPTGAANAPRFEPRHELAGPWAVTFDPKLGGPAEPVNFDKLESWTARPEPGVKFYSGQATYRLTFDLPRGLAADHLSLDLGDLRELAEVRLNGQLLGVQWAPPFRVDLAGAVKPTGNVLEVDVVNFWPNRIVGDQSLSEAQRITRTNVRKITKETPLAPSGLFGPVRLVERVAE